LSQSFEGLGLRAELCRAVAEKGYTSPTPIQAQAIPPILEGRDVRAAAQTGTGKTAGFSLPMLQRLCVVSVPADPRPVRALVLTPTRELALQVEESIRAYGRHLPLKSTLIFGGVAMGPQVDALDQGVDILVATPGRLLDHVAEKTVDLGEVEVLVLDEADRMLDMGFIHDIRKVLALLPRERQNLLFSATFPPEIVELAGSLLHDPVAVQVARANADAELVAQKIHPVDPGRKRELLCHLVREGDWQQVLVFARTKHGANRLAMQLAKQGITADSIHGNRSQPQRLRALKNFKDGVIRVLVATDIAARGIDIEELPHVINYDLPRVPEDYVHRIGRTGRAGNAGEAISLVTPEDVPLLVDIEKLLQRNLERVVVPGFEPGQAPPEGSAPPQREAREPREPSEPRPPREPRQQQARADKPRRERDQQRVPHVEAGGEPEELRADRQPDEDFSERRPAEPRGERQPMDPRAERPARQQRRPVPALLRGPMDERAIQARGNVALPGEDRWSDAEPAEEEEDDFRQPMSNESSLFPSSGRVFGEPKVRGGARHGGGGNGNGGGNANGNRGPRPEGQKKRGGGGKPGGGGQRRRGKGGGGQAHPATGNPRRAG
jgi:ATP-dependent RNA helicase RhlE